MQKAEGDAPVGLSGCCEIRHSGSRLLHPRCDHFGAADNIAKSAAKSYRRLVDAPKRCAATSPKVARRRYASDSRRSWRSSPNAGCKTVTSAPGMMRRNLSRQEHQNALPLMAHRFRWVRFRRQCCRDNQPTQVSVLRVHDLVRVPFDPDYSCGPTSQERGCFGAT